MKILALTDIHGSYATAEKIIQKESADVVILGGDLTNVGTVKEVENAVKKFLSTAKQLFCVAGNMDLPQHDDAFVQLGVSINARGVIIDDVGFFGVSAAPHSPLHTPYEISEQEIAERIEQGFVQVKQSRYKVFVPHAPPYGTKVDIVHAGFHVGSTAVREFIELHKPDIVICGHIHEARGQDTIEQTKIVNCGPTGKGYYAIIEIADNIIISNCSASVI